MNEKDSLMALNAIPGLGNVGIRKLIRRFGSADAVLKLAEADFLEDPLVPVKTIHNILGFPVEQFLSSEHDLLEQNDVQVVTILDKDYPALLREIPDPPTVLYCQGQWSSQAFGLSMAMVGSRKASLYGLSVASQFAERFAEVGFTVVSGMARGVDTAVHMGALRGRGVTVAVLGCGLSHIYPPENKKLFEEIIQNGMALSEFPMRTPPAPYNFPRRNRIISGLSLGVIVVEAARRSGALITADFALEQGREVFAVPGKIDHPTAQGTHQLIKQGAKLVTSVEDVLEDLKPYLWGQLGAERELGSGGEIHRPPVGPQTKNRMAPSTACALENPLSVDEQSVLEHISDRPVHIDELTQTCGPSVPMMSVLLQLELKHLVKQLPGKLFVHR